MFRPVISLHGIQPVATRRRDRLGSSWQQRFCLFTALAVGICTSHADDSPGATALLNRYLAANGAESRAASTSEVIVSRVTLANGEEYLEIVCAKRPNKLRIEIVTEEGRVIQGFDGKNAWLASQRVGGHIESMAADRDFPTRIRLLAESALSNDVAEAKARGSHFDIGEAENAAKWLTLRVFDPKTEYFELELDPQTLYPTCRRSPQGLHPIEIRYGKYQTKSGIPVPLEHGVSIDGKEQRHSYLCSVSFNEPLPEDLFIPPGQSSSGGNIPIVMLTPR